MTLNSIGDLARGLTLRARSTEIKTQIETLSYEMSTGQVKDISDHLAGDFSHLLDLDRTLSQLDAFNVATAETRLFTDAMQLSLGTISDSVSQVSAALLPFGTSNQSVTHEQASVQAQNELDTMMSALNTRAGGRSLYSGTATDISPMPSADTLLNALRTELIGLASVDAMLQVAEDWFNDPAGFDSIIYQGSPTALAPMQVSENEAVNIPITATDPALKDALRGVAIAALATDPTLNLMPVVQTDLFTRLGVDLANTQAKVVNNQAQVGAAQARVDEAITRNAFARTSAEYARGALIGADPYETAAQLQTVQFQLESLYSVTVRNSNLALVNFL